MRKLLGTISMLLLLVCACQKEEPSITLSETEIDAVYTAGEVSITIEPNVSWTAEVHYNDWREEKWIELPVTSGLEGPQRFVIRLPENPTRIREAKVYFHLAGTQELTILYVRQIGKLDRDMTDQLDVYTAAAMMLAHPPLGYISYEDILKCKSLTYRSLPKDMAFRGLSMFQNLTAISIIDSSVSSLDLSEIPWLKNLYLTNSVIGSLDLSGNPGLEDLHLKDVSLRSLDTSKNPNLWEIDIEHSERTPDIESIILGPGVMLFGISNAKSLETLDCSGATSLISMSFPNCNVHSLDISRSQIQYLEIRQNPIDELLLPEDLVTLTLNMCSGSLSYLRIGPKVRDAYLFGVELRELILEDAVSLSRLDCGYNMLERLDVSGIPFPSYLLFNGNPGIGGVFDLIVSPSDYDYAMWLYGNLRWEMENGDTVVTRIVSGE